MNNIRGMLLFILKSFVFSVIFSGTVFGIYAISPFNSPKENVSDNSNSMNIAEYNRQIEESGKQFKRLEELLKRAEANMTEQEKNTKRMAAILVLRSSINSAIRLVMGVFHGQKVGEI